jgi:KipI family sensor histidine kinase inhibitor
MIEGPKIKPSGDSALLVEFENRIDPEVNRLVRALALTIESDRPPGVQEILPAYRTVMVTYDPLQIEYPLLVEKIQGWLNRSERIDLPPKRLFRLPTVYGKSHGPDLEHVAQVLNLPPEEVIRIFSQTRFLVYFIGFICGLAYLGGMPEKLRVPRLASPRTLVPAGSVGFAGGQANAIATDQPSGFNYIGRTYVILYDPQVFPPIPFVAGDEVSFPPVSEEEALREKGRRAEDFL